jgi:hypothetical protein
MFSSSMLFSLLVQLVIGGLIGYILLWAVDKIIPVDPVNKVAKAIIVLLLVLWLINILLGLSGGGFHLIK